jgi:hypothetical protein
LTRLPSRTATTRTPPGKGHIRSRTRIAARMPHVSDSPDRRLLAPTGEPRSHHYRRDRCHGSDDESHYERSDVPRCPLSQPNITVATKSAGATRPPTNHSVAARGHCRNRRAARRLPKCSAKGHAPATLAARGPAGGRGVSAGQLLFGVAIRVSEPGVLRSLATTLAPAGRTRRLSHRWP